MRHLTAIKLARAEWEFAQVEAALADLGTLLHECAEDAPDCSGVALTLKAMRRTLRRAWHRVEPDVTRAHEIAETIEAPF